MRPTKGALNRAPREKAKDEKNGAQKRALRAKNKALQAENKELRKKKRGK
jgi:hypothetical protein